MAAGQKLLDKFLAVPQNHLEAILVGGSSLVVGGGEVFVMVPDVFLSYQQLCYP